MNANANTTATANRRRGRPRRTPNIVIEEEVEEVITTPPPLIIEEEIINEPSNPPPADLLQEEIIELDLPQDQDVEQVIEMEQPQMNIIDNQDDNTGVFETIMEEVIDTDNEDEGNQVVEGELEEEEIVDDDPEPLDLEKCPCCMEEEWGNTWTKCGHPLCVGCYTHLINTPGYFGQRQDQCPMCRTIMTEPPVRALSDEEKLADYERMKKAFEDFERQQNTQENHRERFNRQHYQQRVNELSATNLNYSRRIRQLEEENTQLRNQLGGGAPIAQAPVAQGNNAVARPNRVRRAPNDPARPAGRNDPVNLEANQVLGDLPFARRPRAKCACEGCERMTRRVCDGCRNRRVCQEHSRCPDCN